MRPVVLSSVALYLLLSGCGGNNAASALAKPPEFAPEGQTKCSVVKSHDKPLVVEWPSADRGELEARAQRGLVAVHYSGCEMQVLHRCMIDAKYTYHGLTRKRDHVSIKNADDLYTHIPLGAARLEGKLKTSGELDVETTLVGRWESERPVLRVNELQGECKDATHFISALTVGAFTFSAAADAAVGASATVLGAGGGANSSSKREMLNADGIESACEKASSDDKAPPAQCGALLRLEVTRLADAAAPTPVDPAKLFASRRVLPNGLTVIVHEDHSAPVVGVGVFYAAGSAYDPPGREGMAHLFEHAMFSLGPPGKTSVVDNLRASGVKEFNAKTTRDLLAFYDLVPRSALAEVLSIEADRMSVGVVSRVDSTIIGKAREDVRRKIELLEQRPATKLYGAVSRAISAEGQTSVSGTIAGVDAISLDEAKLFLASHLKATGTTLVLAGDIEREKALTMVESAFGGIPRTVHGPRAAVSAAKLTSEIRVDITGTEAPLLRILWPTPPYNAPGDAALDLAAEILAARDSGRLWRQLVVGAYSAQDLQASQRSSVDGSLFSISATLQVGQRPEDVLRVIDAELTTLRTKEPSNEELTRAREALAGSWRPNSLAEKVASVRNCAALGGWRDRASCADVLAARYKDVTPQGIRDAVRALLPADRRVVGIVSTSPAAPGSGNALPSGTVPKNKSK